MYTLQEKQFFGQTLTNLADKIDLTPAQYAAAKAKYEAVGDFLAQSGTSLAPYRPVVISQGSFRIGTVIKPVKGEEFDVDLTCKLNGTLPGKQYDFKRLIGDRFNDSAVYKPMLEEKRRCWRLHYAESSKFHLDIVPAIPDSPYWLTIQGVPQHLAKHAINITDNERSNYYDYTNDWPKSNPEGYALWFIEVMKQNTRNLSGQLIKALSEHVEDVPYYDVRTPLQRAVQLMKHHKEIMFSDDDDKPVSIIITTLAARAYGDVMNRLEPLEFHDILTLMVPAMRKHIKEVNGVKWVANPVNPMENFADKWQEKRLKETKFMEWLTAFEKMLNSTSLNKGINGLGEELKKSFGDRVVNEAISALGDNSRMLREDNMLKVSGTGLLGSLGIKLPNHTFHGNENKS